MARPEGRSESSSSCCWSRGRRSKLFSPGHPPNLFFLFPGTRDPTPGDSALRRGCHARRVLPGRFRAASAGAEEFELIKLELEFSRLFVVVVGGVKLDENAPLLHPPTPAGASPRGPPNRHRRQLASPSRRLPGGRRLLALPRGIAREAVAPLGGHAHCDADTRSRQDPWPGFGLRRGSPGDNRPFTLRGGLQALPDDPRRGRSDARRGREQLPGGVVVGRCCCCPPRAHARGRAAAACRGDEPALCPSSRRRVARRRLPGRRRGRDQRRRELEFFGIFSLVVGLENGKQQQQRQHWQQQQIGSRGRLYRCRELADAFPSPPRGGIPFEAAQGRCRCGGSARRRSGCCCRGGDGRNAERFVRCSGRKQQQRRRRRR